MPPIKTTLKVLLLISLCFVRYGSYANISSSNTLSTFQESNVQIVIKDKLFYQQLKKASLDTQFRVLIKLSKTARGKTPEYKISMTGENYIKSRLRKEEKKR